MKILGIDASQNKNKDNINYKLLNEAMSSAEELGAKTNIIRLIDYNILECNGCEECLKLRACPLTYEYKDQMDILMSQIEENDGIIFTFSSNNTLPPARLINFFQRLAYKNDLDNVSQPYYIEMIPETKGYAFMSKKIGLICTGFTFGMENAIGCLFPIITSLRATVSACTTIALNELNDRGITPTVQGNGKNTIDFAIKIARGIGKRVVTGTQAFDMTYNYLKKDTIMNRFDFKLEKVESLDGETVNLNKYKGKDKIIVIAGQKANSESVRVVMKLLKCITNLHIDVIPVASVEKIPGFLTKDFIKGMIIKQIGENIEQFEPIIDWDMEFAKALNVDIQNERPTMLFYDKLDNLIRRIDEVSCDDDFEKIVKDIIKEEE